MRVAEISQSAAASVRIQCPQTVRSLLQAVEQPLGESASFRRAYERFSLAGAPMLDEGGERHTTACGTSPGC